MCPLGQNLVHLFAGFDLLGCERLIHGLILSLIPSVNQDFGLHEVVVHLRAEIFVCFPVGPLQYAGPALVIIGVGFHDSVFIQANALNVGFRVLSWLIRGAAGQ